MQTVLGTMCKLLAVAWRPPTAGAWVEAVASGMMARDLAEAARALALPEAAVSRCAEALAGYEGRDGDEVLHALRREETRLFIGPDPVVENAEGTWLQREHGVRHPVRMINNHTVAVADFMGTCGVARKPQYNDCIDYLANELDFCGYVADNAEALAAEGVDAAERLEAFADEHLSLWVPGFCDQVEAEAREPFYQGVAALTRAFVRALS